MIYPLKELDRVEIFVLMDNVSDPFTQNDQGIYWNESQYKFGVRKINQTCGAIYCRACNGLSLLLRLYKDDKRVTVLFDTGPDAGLAVENAQKLGLDLTEVEAIILSHGHFDHYGGTLSALKAINKPNLPVFIHPDLFTPRAFGQNNLVVVSDNLSNAIVEQHGGDIIESADPLTIFDDMALISGEVPSITRYELGQPDEHRLENNQWHASPTVIEERCLILNIKNKGLCVITGCGHTGVVNALLHGRNLVNQQKIHFVMGGFHLAGPKFDDRIQPTIADLKLINPDFIITGHCTGRKTQAMLTAEFSNRHVPYGVGSYFNFD